MKVSVIIPCYNAESHLNDTLQSVLDQTHEDIEIVCIDDGSTDKTSLVLKIFKKNNPNRVKIITQLNNGACSARNLGLKYSRGEFIQFLDADDKLLPNKIKNQIEIIKKCRCDIVIGSYKRINSSGKEIFSRVYSYENQMENLWDALIKSNLGITSSNLFKKSLFDNKISWNENYVSSQEYRLMFDLLKLEPIVCFDELENTLILNREGSISNTNICSNLVTFIKLRIEIIKFLKQQKIKLNNSYYQLLYEKIRELYIYDSGLALKFFSLYIPVGFKPVESIATSKKHLFFKNIFGFRLTQKLSMLLKKWYQL